MEIKAFTIPAMVYDYRDLKDGGLSIIFHSTLEVTDEDLLEIRKRRGSVGHLLFKENEFDIEDIPEDDVEDERKTASQRLRAVLYYLHKQKGGKKEDFPRWYRRWMEAKIDSIKEDLT